MVRAQLLQAAVLRGHGGKAGQVQLQGAAAGGVAGRRARRLFEFQDVLKRGLQAPGELEVRLGLARPFHDVCVQNLVLRRTPARCVLEGIAARHLQAGVDEETRELALGAVVGSGRGSPGPLGAGGALAALGGVPAAGLAFRRPRLPRARRVARQRPAQAFRFPGDVPLRGDHDVVRHWMKRVLVRGLCRAGSGSVPARGLGGRRERAGAFAAVLGTPATRRLASSVVKWEGAAEISLKALWKGEQRT